MTGSVVITEPGNVRVTVSMQMTIAEMGVIAAALMESYRIGKAHSSSTVYNFAELFSSAAENMAKRSDGTVADR